MISNTGIPHFLTGDPILLFNGRSGIKLALDSLRPKNIWLPSYLCPTILTAIDPQVSRTHFYAVDDYLKVRNFDFIKGVKRGDIFLYIDYFGFPFDNNLLRELKQKDVILFQDCSQALFYKWLEPISDFCLYSPRKFLGVPDGGILKINLDYQIDTPILDDPPEDVFTQLFWAVVKKREFDINGDKNDWNEFFIRGEKALTPGRSRMSDLSKFLLKNSFDYETISHIRRDNYQMLLNELCDFALFQDFPVDVVPLGFPIKVENRDILQRELFKLNIFPPIHWTIKGVIPNQFDRSHLLSQTIMTLPCDQRYGEEEMEFIAKVILEKSVKK